MTLFDFELVSYWEYIFLAYTICALVLSGLIIYYQVDKYRLKKLILELENQENTDRNTEFS